MFVLKADKARQRAAVSAENLVPSKAVPAESRRGQKTPIRLA